MASEEIESSEALEDFYNYVRLNITQYYDHDVDMRYIMSRSTRGSIEIIERLCSFFDSFCRQYAVPTEGIFLKKTDLSVKLFKLLICNTSFFCQLALAQDVDSGYLVNLYPPFSPYLFVEIIWHLHFEDILAESMLHFPLDLCAEIAEVLPRCLDLLDFQRAVRFLTSFIPNVYKKLVSLKDVGSQTEDFHNFSRMVRKLVENIQELILQFTKKRVFRVLESAEDKIKRCGILLKKIVQMVKFCFCCKYKKGEVLIEMQDLYKLTFGDQPLQKVDASVLDQYLTEINQGFIRLLLKKVKEIDCNMYLCWMDYEDEENTSMTLQRAVGLECYFFLESTKEFIDCDNKDFIHLTECLTNLALKPDPNNSCESMHLTELCQGVSDGKKENLVNLFKRYKEWDNNILDTIDSNLFLVDKEVCELLLNHLATELSNCQQPNDLEKLQLYTFVLARAFISLKIPDLYEIAINFILQCEVNMKSECDIDIADFENFIMHHSNLSYPTNLRVVLFFLCLNTLPTVKILMKMTIGHSDYPDVAISIHDLMILLPVLKIKTETMIETWRNKCEEIREAIPSKEPKHAALAIRVLQDICLEGPKWNPNKFAGLLQAMYGFCKETEIINEILIPFLLMDLCPWNYLKSILVEILKVLDKCDYKLNPNLVLSLNKQGEGLLSSNHTSRYIVDELLTLITDIIKHVRNCTRPEDKIEIFCAQIVGHSQIFLFPTLELGTYNFLQQLVCKSNFKYMSALKEDDTLRHAFLKCTKKQFMEYINHGISVGSILSWKSEADMCDNVIRLTLENCLLCLEYPEVAPPDSISFMLHRLIDILPLITVSKQNTNFTLGICRNLDTHFAILKPSIEHTAISEAYNELIKTWEELKDKLPKKLTALEKFASSCSQESQKLKHFTGPHSPLGLRLWLVYDTITMLFEENITSEKYIIKLKEYLK